MSSPCSKTCDFPNTIFSFLILLFSSPPLGYLIITGFPKLTANSSISSSSLKFAGAIIVKFGTTLKKAISSVP